MLVPWVMFSKEAKGCKQLPCCSNLFADPPSDPPRRWTPVLKSRMELDVRPIVTLNVMGYGVLSGVMFGVVMGDIKSIL